MKFNEKDCPDKISFSPYQAGGLFNGILLRAIVHGYD